MSTVAAMFIDIFTNTEYTDCSPRENNLYSVNKSAILSLEENKKFVEVFNFDKLRFMVEHREEVSQLLNLNCSRSDDPFGVASSYLDRGRKITDHKSHGSILVRYTQTDVDRLGRYNAVNAIGLQFMTRQIRHTIAHEYYHDVDIVNCHPVIIQWLCRNVNIECPQLDKYVAERDSIISTIIRYNPTHDRDTIKRDIIAMIYGGRKGYNSITKRTGFLSKFETEMTRINKKISKLFKELHDARKKVKDFNVEGSTLAYLCCIVENQVLMMMLQYFEKNISTKEYDATVLCFDGLMIRNTIPREVLEGHINRLESMFSDVELPIKLKVKNMEPLALEEIGYSPVKMCDYDDEYYYYDFLNMLTKKGKVFEFSELEAAICNNINRCVMRKSKGGYFVKQDRNHPLEGIKELTSDLISVKFDKKSNKKSNLIEIKSENPEIKLEKSEIMVKPLTFWIKNYFFNSINKFDNIVCSPADDQISERDFNTWSGFKAKRLSKYDVSEIEFILNHIKSVWANHDEAYFHYIKSWFHRIFTDPGNKSKVALVLRSEKQQIGKGIIISGFLAPLVFGEHMAVADAGLDFLTGKFNHVLMNKVLVSADELSSLGDDGYHAVFDVMKSRITEDKIMIEIKGIDKFSVRDYMNFIMCTNNSYTLKIEKDDARYAVFDCSNEYAGNYSYFATLKSHFNARTADIFFSYISDMTDAVDVRMIPETQLKIDMKLNSMTTPLKFIDSIEKLLESKNIEPSEYWAKSILESYPIIQAGKLYSIYTNYCNEEGERKPLSNIIFGREIKSRINKYRSSSGNVYDISTLISQ